MKFKAQALDGKEVEGNYVVYEGLNLIMVKKTDDGMTRTIIIPSTLEEIE